VNYWKAFYALSAAAPDPPATIIDLGSGAGSAASAAIAYYCDRGNLPEADLQVVLVDRSRSQLELAVSAVAATVNCLKVDVNVSVVHRESTDYYQPSSADLVIASHVITENRGAEDKFFTAAESLVKPGGCLLLMERPDDPAWGAVWRSVRRAPARRQDGHATVPAGLLDQSITRDWTVHWVLVEVERRHLLAQTVRRYFNVWETHAVDRLGEVFSPHASYADKSDKEPMEGLWQIERYWHEEVLTQEHTETEIIDIWFAQDFAFIDWAARFTRRQRPYALRGTMALDFDPSTGLINRLREWYRSEHADGVR